MQKTHTILDLPPSERPRERLMHHGASALSVQELLALLLGRGIQGEPVMTTAQGLLAHAGSLKKLAAMSLLELQQVKGIGVAKSAQLTAAFEISRRLLVENTVEDERKKKVMTPQDVFTLVRKKLQAYAKEHFFVLSFDQQQYYLGMDTISVGTLDASLIHPRETFEVAIRHHAASIILVHNHPSGDLSPSDEDVAVTEQLVLAGNVLGITVADHIIVSKEAWLSMREEGFL